MHWRRTEWILNTFWDKFIFDLWICVDMLQEFLYRKFLITGAVDHMLKKKEQ
jgi:hypothetical protein